MEKKINKSHTTVEKQYRWDRKTSILRQTHLHNWIYVHNWNCKQNKALKKVYPSEIWSALDNFFVKVNVCICLYKIEFQNNIWVVQTFRFKLVDYFHKQFWVKRLKPILFTVFHNLTKAIRDRIQNVLKKQRTVQFSPKTYADIWFSITCFGHLDV